LSAAVATLVAILLFQIWQTRAAVFRFSNDPRNPMAYSPTSRDIVMLGERMRALHRKSPAFRAGRIAVLGKGYWPLPWYLRGTSQAGYFDTPPLDLENYPVVIALPEAALEASNRLSGTHEIFYNGLRSEVPLTVFVRRDVRAEEVSIP
jgi:predicted membrane-bound mannosyltransferase